MKKYLYYVERIGTGQVSHEEVAYVINLILARHDYMWELVSTYSLPSPWGSDVFGVFRQEKLNVKS